MVQIAATILTLWWGAMLACIVGALVIYMLYEIAGSVADWWYR